MTDLLSRPVLRVASAGRGSRSSVVMSSVVASLWVAIVGLVGCMVLAVAAWFAADTGSFAAAARIGGLAWLVGSGSGLVLDGVTISLVPLGFVAATGLLLHRGGRWVVARCEVVGVRDIALAITVMSITYPLALLTCALVVRTDDASVSLLRVTAAGLAVALVAGGSGVLRESGLLGSGVGRLPEDVRGALVGGLAGLAVMVAAASLLLVGSLVAHFSEAVELAEGLGAGYVGGLVLAVVGTALVPNAVLCAGAFLAGPGFAVGTGTMVAPGEVELGPLPAFPLLAALPQGTGAGWVDLLVIVPVVSGVVAGVLAVRACPAFTIDRVALRGALAGCTGGVLFGLSGWLATGSAGPGRMQDVGPDVWPVVAVCALAGLVGGALGAVGARWLPGAR